MKRNTLSIFILALLLGGCALNKKIMLETQPSEASVFYHNAFVGNTPFNAVIKFADKKEVQNFHIVKNGYEDTTLLLSYSEILDNYLINLLKKEVVAVKIISYEPINTVSGNRLSKVVRLTRAFLENIERSPNVSSATKITNFSDSLSQVGTIALSPDGANMVYSLYSYENGINTSALWRQGISSSNRTRLTFGQRIDLFPYFSGDGKFIYFSSTRNSPSSQIWRVSINGGGGLTKIITSQTEDYFPTTDPNNQRITYTSKPIDNEDPQIWLAAMNGALPTQLREGEYPIISPDGTRILYTREDKTIRILENDSTFNPKQIWVMDIDGFNETLLTDNTTYNCSQPGWSPDGSLIVFVSDEGKDIKGVKNNDIWRMRSDGTQKTQLTTNGSWDDCPVWNSKDHAIYFRSNRGGIWNIWKLKL